MIFLGRGLKIIERIACSKGSHNRPVPKDWLLGVDSWRAVGKISTCLGDVAQLGERCRRMAEAEGSTPFVSTPLDLISRRHCVGGFFKKERAELWPSLSPNHCLTRSAPSWKSSAPRRPAARLGKRPVASVRELAALRAERAKAEEAAANAAPAPKPAPSAPRPAAAKPAPAAPKPQPKKAARPKPVEPKPSRDEMTFAQRMVTSKEPTGERMGSPAWLRLKSHHHARPYIALSLYGLHDHGQHGPALTCSRRAPCPHVRLVQPSTSAQRIRKVAPWL